MRYCFLPPQPSLPLSTLRNPLEDCQQQVYRIRSTLSPGGIYKLSLLDSQNLLVLPTSLPKPNRNLQARNAFSTLLPLPFSSLRSSLTVASPAPCRKKASPACSPSRPGGPSAGRKACRAKAYKCRAHALTQSGGQ